MADLTLRLDFRVTPTVFRWALAGLLLSGLAAELSPESVTLSTYYPAPSGVYTQMITTNNTYLARDSGRVGVGITNPGAKLHVVAPGGVGNEPIRAQSNSTFFSGFDGSGNQKFAINNDGAGNNTLDFYGSDSGGWFVFMSVDNTGGKATTFPNDVVVGGEAEVDGVLFAKNYGSCNGGAPTFYTAGVTSCPGGTYATLVSGVLSKYQICGNDILPPPNQGDGNMLCCTCPAGTCPNF